MSKIRTTRAGLLAALLMASFPTAALTERRANLIASIQSIYAGLDRDHDDLVTRAEWDFMVEAAMETRLSDPVPLGNPEQLRAGWRHMFDVEDSDRDGTITLSEMLAIPAATFDCMDANRDDELTQEETFAGMTSCEHLAIRMPETGGEPGDR